MIKRPNSFKNPDLVMRANSKVSEYQVIQIIKDLKEGRSRQSIADQYYISVGTVRAIANGKTWKWVPRD